jgi:hypothetical protein
VKNSAATFGHKSFVMNSHLPGNPPVLDRTLVQNHIGIDRLVIRPQFRDLKEPLHLAQGGTAGRVHKGMLSMQAQGRIEVPNATQAASMEDQEKALRLAFDPYECYRDSPTTDGVYPLSWLEPTLDTTNYASGWMPVTRYVRPVAQPETEWSITDQSYRQWSVGLVAPDPRLYGTTLGSLAGSASSTVVNKGTVSGPLRVTLTMSGAGHAFFQIFPLARLTNGNFETGDLTGWNVAGTTVSVAGSPGAYYADLYPSGVTPGIDVVVPATPGVPTSIWASASNPSSATGFAWYVIWYRADGSLIWYQYMDGVTVSTTTRQPIFHSSDPAPAGAATARVGIRNITAASHLYVDDVSVSSGSFQLDLSGCGNGDVVVATMETSGPFGAGKSITRNGGNAFALKLSGPTSWLNAPVGTTTFLLMNNTNVASILYEWGHARP